MDLRELEKRQQRDEDKGFISRIKELKKKKEEHLEWLINKIHED